MIHQRISEFHKQRVSASLKRIRETIDAIESNAAQSMTSDPCEPLWDIYVAAVASMEQLEAIALAAQQAIDSQFVIVDAALMEWTDCVANQNP